MRTPKTLGRLPPALALALMVDVAACGAPVEPQANATSPLASAVEDLHPNIHSLTYSGDLCPDGSALGRYGAPGAVVSDAFTVIFSQATINAPKGAVTRTCRVVLELDVPAGYQFGSPYFVSRGLGQPGDPRGVVKLDTKYGFDGASESSAFTLDLGAKPQGDFTATDRALAIWSPSCAAPASPSRVRLDIDVSVSVDGEAMFALDSLDSALSYRDGVDWRRCGETQPQSPPASAKAAYCGGPHNQPCGSALSCELDGEAVLGTCVDAQESVPAKPMGESCGGVRAIACQAGLVCVFASAQSVSEKRLGRCTPEVGGEGNFCGPYPTVPCGNGLSCDSAKSHTCVSATGALDSHCGEGLPECNAGLQCAGSYCK